MQQDITLDQITEVIRLFSKEFKTIGTISDLTGVSYHFASKITDRYLSNIMKPQVVEETYHIYESKINFMV